MSLTYGELNNTIGTLAKKYGIIQEAEENDQSEFDEEESLRIYKMEFYNKVENTLNHTILVQVLGENYESGLKNIDSRTELSNESLFSIYSHIHEFETQDILIELAFNFLNEEECIIFENLLEAYAINGNKEVLIFIDDRNLSRKIPKKSFIYNLIDLIDSGDDLFQAIRKLLIKNGVNPNDKKILENRDIPEEIKGFLFEFNNLLLTKLGNTNLYFIEQKSTTTLH